VTSERRGAMRFVEKIPLYTGSASIWKVSFKTDRAKLPFAVFSALAFFLVAPRLEPAFMEYISLHRTEDSIIALLGLEKILLGALMVLFSLVAGLVLDRLSKVLVRLLLRDELKERVRKEKLREFTILLMKNGGSKKLVEDAFRIANPGEETRMIEGAIAAGIAAKLAREKDKRRKEQKRKSRNKLA
jgi:hypothetical protein